MDNVDIPNNTKNNLCKAPLSDCICDGKIDIILFPGSVALFDVVVILLLTDDGSFTSSFKIVGFSSLSDFAGFAFSIPLFSFVLSISWGSITVIEI